MSVAATTRPLILFALTHGISARVLLGGQLPMLHGSGFDVVVVASPGGDLTQVAALPGVSVIALDLPREAALLRDVVALCRLAGILGRRRPLIVNASTPKAGLLGMLAARLVGVPIRVYTLRGLRLETTRGAARRALEAAERVAASCAHAVVCVSESLRRQWSDLRLGPAAKAVVLGAGSSNGVDTGRFRVRSAAELAAVRARLGVAPDAPVIGFVGRFTRDKGIADLLAAFDAVAFRFPAARLLALGDFEDGDPVAAEVRRRLESDARVLRPGFVRDTAEYYAAMDVLAFPSYREGFPNAPLEAAASGVPVVGFAATGTVDAVVDGVTGRLVPVGNVNGLVEACASYLESPERRRRDGAAGRERVVREFRQELVWERWVRFYRELLAARGHAPARAGAGIS